MNLIKKLIICLSTLLNLSACDKEVTPESDRDKTIYALGSEVGNGLARYHLTESDLKFLKAGLEDKVLGKEPKIVSHLYLEKIQELGGGYQPEPTPQPMTEVVEPKATPPPPPAKIQPKPKAKTKAKPKVAVKKVVKKTPKKKVLKKKTSIQN